MSNLMTQAMIVDKYGFRVGVEKLAEILCITKPSVTTCIGFLNLGSSCKAFATCVERTVTKSALLIHQLRK